jgi:hypothetical protein
MNGVVSQADDPSGFDIEPADYADESAAPPLGDLQFRLSGLFGLVTVAAVYFALERIHHGRFALHAVVGTLLLVLIVLPALWTAAWLARSAVDSGVAGLLLLALAVGSGAAAGLFLMARF